MATEYGILGEFDETLQSVWARWAFDLWGITEGQTDVDDNCKQARRWFIEPQVRSEHVLREPPLSCLVLQAH